MILFKRLPLPSHWRKTYAMVIAPINSVIRASKALMCKGVFWLFTNKSKFTKLVDIAPMHKSIPKLVSQKSGGNISISDTFLLLSLRSSSWIWLKVSGDFPYRALSNKYQIRYFLSPSLLESPARLLRMAWKIINITGQIMAMAIGEIVTLASYFGCNFYLSTFSVCIAWDSIFLGFIGEFNSSLLLTARFCEDVWFASYAYLLIFHNFNYPNYISLQPH